MNYGDLINAGFELGGAIFICRHIRRLHIDKMVRGVDWVATAFFTVWGFWNIYYYGSLDQWLSWSAGLAIVAANTVWLVMMLHYIGVEKRQQEAQ